LYGKCLAVFSGYDLPAAIQYIDIIWNQIKSSNFQTRLEIFERHAAVYLWDGIRLAKRRHRGKLALHYLFYTLVQACNCTIMFLWVNHLFDSPIYSWSGPSILADLIDGKDWQKTGHFPRITHCDFSRRSLASSKPETVMCVLTLNIYYEKLLIFLWFWVLFVGIVSWANCFCWGRILCFPGVSKNKLQSFLNIHSGQSGVYIEKFLRELGPDGVFILNQISLNIGELPTSYLTVAMYNKNSDENDLLEKGLK